jgi:hypothetical protein
MKTSYCDVGCRAGVKYKRNPEIEEFPPSSEKLGKLHTESEKT